MRKGEIADFIRFSKMFEVREEARPGYEHLGPCWDWLEAPVRGGYGTFDIGGKWHPAHRYSYEAHVGPLPGRHTDVDHRCHNRLCVNYEHLRPVTRSENLQNLDPLKANERSSVGVGWVSWSEERKRYLVGGSIDGKHRVLARFEDLDDAADFAFQWRAENLPFSYEAGLVEATSIKQPERAAA